MAQRLQHARQTALGLLAFLVCLVHFSEANVTWTRDKQLDNVVKVNVTSHPPTELEVPGRAASVRYCASLCAANASCSSFFFLPVSAKCILHEIVFTKKKGVQSAPGARYFKAVSEDCPARDGYVWLRGHHTCIKVYVGPSTFYWAQGNCTHSGSQLVILDSGDKHRAVAAYIADTYANSSHSYIGATRDGVVNASRTSWNNAHDPLFWLNGVQVPLNGSDNFWGVGGPSNNGNSEGCMELYYGLWNDVPCIDLNRIFNFICEKLVN